MNSGKLSKHLARLRQKLSKAEHAVQMLRADVRRTEVRLNLVMDADKVAAETR
jgi:hypothetical protein